MTRKPTPHDDVPDFIVERFEDHSSEELRDITSYAERNVGSEDVPDYVVHAFAMQDDETKTVIAIYASELATYLEETTETDGEDDGDDPSDDPAGEDRDEDDRPPGPGTMGGAFFG